MIKTNVHVIRPHSISEEEVMLPDLEPGDVEVEVLYNGVCHSDIKLYQSKDPFIAPNFSGHEGVGKVINSYNSYFIKGDIVATCWHPCYTDHSIWKGEKCVHVPEPWGMYAVQPLACIILPMYTVPAHLSVLVLGTGYFARIINMLRREEDCTTHFFGRAAGAHYFSDRFVDEIRSTQQYDVVIDVSGKYDRILSEHVTEGGRYIVVANNDTPLSLNSWECSWKNITVEFPSPRSPYFMKAMEHAVQFVSNNHEELARFCTIQPMGMIQSVFDNPRDYVKVILDTQR